MPLPLQRTIRPSPLKRTLPSVPLPKSNQPTWPASKLIDKTI